VLRAYESGHCATTAERTKRVLTARDLNDRRALVVRTGKVNVHRTRNGRAAVHGAHVVVECYDKSRATSCGAPTDVRNFIQTALFAFASCGVYLFRDRDDVRRVKLHYIGRAW
jgi:hypothetical protein